VRELISSVVKGDFDWPEVSFLVGLRWVDSGRIFSSFEKL